MPWLTGDTIPTAKNCRVIRVPDDPVFIQAVSGALLDLTYPHNWEQHGALTPDEQAAAFDDVYIEFSKSRCDVTPVGATMLWHMETPPDRWLICDGSGYLKAEYPELFALFGAKYGDSPDFFGVPDLREKVPYGADFLIPLDATYGEVNHTLTVAEMPAHTHTLASPFTSIIGARPSGGGAATTGTTLAGGAALNNTGGGGAHNNIQPSYGVYFIVYAGRAA